MRTQKKLSVFLVLIFGFWMTQVFGDGNSFLKDELKTKIEIQNFLNEKKNNLDKKDLVEKMKEKMRSFENPSQPGGTNGGSSTGEGMVRTMDVVGEVVGVAPAEFEPHRNSGKSWFDQLLGVAGEKIKEAKEALENLMKNFIGDKRKSWDKEAREKAADLARKYPSPHQTEEERTQNILNRINKGMDGVLKNFEEDLKERGPAALSSLDNTYGNDSSTPETSTNNNPSSLYDYGALGENTPLASPAESTDALGENAGTGSSDGTFLPAPKESLLASTVKDGKILRKGDKGPEVKEMQERLGKLGFGVEPTGTFGPTTEKALKDFQKAYGIGGDGKMGPTTFKTMEEAEKTPNVESVRRGAVLEQGAEGKPVSDLQKRLSKAGFGVEPTGKFGPTTEKVLKDFQKANGVEPTGKFGPTTLKALEKSENKMPYESGAIYTAYNNGRATGKIQTVYIDGKPVSTTTAQAYHRMATDAARAGVNLKVVSGFRTNDQQAYLYRLYKSGQGNLAAYPGYSNHQNGLAIDLNTSDRGVYNWLSRNGRKYGFIRTVPSEKWHWEYRP